MATQYTVERFEGGMHYIVLDEATILPFTANGNKRIICKFNNSVSFHCAILFKKDIGYYIHFGMAICKQLGLKKGVTVTAAFSLDATTYQFKMPEELQEVLAADDEASAAFEALTPGKQRGLMYVVTQVKSTDKRIERALKIAEKIKCGITSPKIILK